MMRTTLEILATVTLGFALAALTSDEIAENAINTARSKLITTSC